MIFALQTGWIAGWIAGAAVTVVAATLLIAIIALGRRIVRQAQDITAALDGARGNTDAMFDVARTNLAMARIVQALQALRTGGRQ